MIHPRSWGPGVHLHVEIQGVLSISGSLVCTREYMAWCLSYQSLVDFSVRFERVICPSLCREIICRIQRNIAAGELAVQWRYEMILIEMRKGYDLRRLTLGINLSHAWNPWKLLTWSNESSCCVSSCIFLKIFGDRWSFWFFLQNRLKTSNIGIWITYLWFFKLHSHAVFEWELVWLHS